MVGTADATCYCNTMLVTLTYFVTIGASWKPLMELGRISVICSTEVPQKRSTWLIHLHLLEVTTPCHICSHCYEGALIDAEKYWILLLAPG